MTQQKTDAEQLREWAELFRTAKADWIAKGVTDPEVTSMLDERAELANRAVGVLDRLAKVEAALRPFLEWRRASDRDWQNEGCRNEWKDMVKAGREALKP